MHKKGKSVHFSLGSRAVYKNINKSTLKCIKASHVLARLMYQIIPYVLQITTNQIIICIKSLQKSESQEQDNLSTNNSNRVWLVTVLLIILHVQTHRKVIVQDKEGRPLRHHIYFYQFTVS